MADDWRLMQAAHDRVGLGAEWAVEANRRRALEAKRRRQLRPTGGRSYPDYPPHLPMLGPRSLAGEILPLPEPITRQSIGPIRLDGWPGFWSAR